MHFPNFGAGNAPFSFTSSFMSIRFHQPAGFLKDFVSYIGFLSGDEIGTGVAFPRLHQVIIINAGTRFSSSDIYAAAPVLQETSDTIWINGKQDLPFMLGNRGETAMYAIGLQAGRLPWLAGLPAMETNDLTVGADNWAPDNIYALREQLLSGGDVQKGFLLIEAWLTRLLVKKDLSRLAKVKWLESAIHTHSVQEICRQLGVTRKQLRSETQYYFGGSVKNLQGLIRFNKTLASIANNAGRTLSSLHEYYDQSHFINDFRARTGITPLQYKRLCQQYPAIRYTPNFLPMQRETFLQFIAG